MGLSFWEEIAQANELGLAEKIQLKKIKIELGLAEIELGKDPLHDEPWITGIAM